jgi:hypothetical protein
MALSDSRLAASRRAANRSALTAVACFLQMTRSLHSFLPSLCLADSASVVRNVESCFSANIRKSDWRRSCAASRHLWPALKMGFLECVDTRVEILNMLATAWLRTNVRHHGLGVSQLRSMKATGLLGSPRGLDQLVPAFQF